MLILNFKISFHSAQHQKYQTALFMKIQKSTWIHGVKSLIGMTLMMDGMKNSKVFDQKGDLLNFKANIDPRAVLSRVKPG